MGIFSKKSDCGPQQQAFSPKKGDCSPQQRAFSPKNSISLASLALEQSEEALRITTNRFQQGLEKTTELLFAETQFLEKEMAYYESVFNLNYAHAYLEFLSK